MAVYFLDTSILLNLLEVPNRSQASDEVKAAFEDAVGSQERYLFVLPLAAVIETGNFVAQISDGGLRRKTAEKLVKFVRKGLSSEAPWEVYADAWGREFLTHLLNGDETIPSLVECATMKIGLADISILAEASHYQAATHVEALVWSLDKALSSYGAVSRLGDED